MKSRGAAASTRRTQKQSMFSKIYGSTLSTEIVQFVTIAATAPTAVRTGASTTPTTAIARGISRRTFPSCFITILRMFPSWISSSTLRTSSLPETSNSSTTVLSCSLTLAPHLGQKLAFSWRVALQILQYILPSSPTCPVEALNLLFMWLSLIMARQHLAGLDRNGLLVLPFFASSDIGLFERLIRQSLKDGLREETVEKSISQRLSFNP